MCETSINQLPLAHATTGNQAIIQTCALTRNWTGDLLLCGTTANKLSHAIQGRTKIFNLVKFVTSRIQQGCQLVQQHHPFNTMCDSFQGQQQTDPEFTKPFSFTLRLPFPLSVFFLWQIVRISGPRVRHDYIPWHQGDPTENEAFIYLPL